MSRLTKGNEKHNNEFISYVVDIGLYPEMMGYEQTQAEMDAINKLGKLEDLEEELYDNLLSWSREAFGEEGVKKFNLNSKKFFDNFDEYRSKILSDPLDYIVEFCNLFLEVINYE